MTLDETLRELRDARARGHEFRARRLDAKFWVEVIEQLRRGTPRRHRAADRDDIVQLALIVVIRRIDDYVQTAPDSLERWLRVIAGNTTRAWERMTAHERAQLGTLVQRAVSSSIVTPTTRLGLREARSQLTRLLPKLRSHEIRLVHHDLADGDDSDLARSEGVAVGTIWSRRSRLKSKLRALSAHTPNP